MNANAASAPLTIIVAGVAGSGKSTFGTALAHRLDWRFVEGDDFHSAANRAKMACGEPLDDEDRAPWLAALTAEIRRARAAGERTVVGCSALKQVYRAQLAALPATAFVFLKIDRDTARRRVVDRADHYMPVGLIDSQFDALEPPTAAPGRILIIDADRPLEEMIASTLSALPLEP